MSGLKATVLTVSGLALWLAPPFLLSRKVPLHNLTTGAALITGFACCFEARKLALKVAKEEDFEAMKEAVVVADTVDELATTAYISEQQRRKETERILNDSAEHSEAVEHLERALSLECSTEPVEPATEPLNHPQESDFSAERERFTALELDAEQAIKLIQKLRAELNQTQIIEKLWSVRKGGSADWKRAREQFRQLTGE